MKSATFRPFLLSLALPLCAAAPAWAGDESTNNTVLVKVPASVKYDWKLSFVSGQDPKVDSIKIVPLMTNSPAATVLSRANDTMVFKPGKSYSVIFAPNSGKDGSKYVVKLADSLASCSDCVPRARNDQYVLFKAEKPESTLLSTKAGRKLTLTLDWNADRYIQFSGMGQAEEQEKPNDIQNYFQDGTLTIPGNFF